MDTIRKKMYLLKLETSDTINRLLTVETAAARNSEALKDREQNLRKLMKEVSKRDNGESDNLNFGIECTVFVRT